jgi:hypothetical protein
MSEDALKDCPNCGKPDLARQISAVGFALKGSGWYVTDFRGGNTGGKAAEAAADKPASDASASDGKPADKPAADKPAAAAPAAASPPPPAPST